MIRKTTLLTAALVTAALSAAVAPSANAASVDTWERMADCESSGNWASNTGTYYGGLQFSQSTWVAQGGTAYAARADLATKEQQIRIAEKLLRAAGPGQWPVCSKRVGLTNDGIDPYPAIPPTVRQARTVAADFDGDGRVDVAGIDAYQNLNLYAGNGAGQVSATLPMLGTGGLWAGFKRLAAGDFNGDGKQDVAGIDANDSLKLYTGTGGGYVSGGSAMLGGNGTWAGFKAITAGDFNGDGKADIAGIDANDSLKLYAG
ncbi:transglycosylase family protein, partial [Kitasatospora sp. NPDC001664]